MKTTKTSNALWSIGIALALSAILTQGQTAQTDKPATTQQRTKVVLPASKTPVNKPPVTVNQRLQQEIRSPLIPKQKGRAQQLGVKRTQPASGSQSALQTINKSASPNSQGSSSKSKGASEVVYKSKKQDATKKPVTKQLTSAQVLNGVGLPQELTKALVERIERDDVEAAKTAKLVLIASRELQFSGANQALIDKTLKEIVDRRLTDPSPGGAADQLIANAYLLSSPYLAQKERRIPKWANGGLTVRSSLGAAANFESLDVKLDDPTRKAAIDTIINGGLVGTEANNVVGAAVIKSQLGADVPSSAKGREWEVARGVLAANVLVLGSDIEKGSRSHNIAMNTVLNQGLGPRDATALAWETITSDEQNFGNNNTSGAAGTARPRKGNYSSTTSSKSPTSNSDRKDSNGDENYTPAEQSGYMAPKYTYVKYDDDDSGTAGTSGSGGGSTNPDATETEDTNSESKESQSDDSSGQGVGGLDFSDVDPNAGAVTQEERDQAWSTPKAKTYEANQETDGNEQSNNDSDDDDKKGTEVPRDREGFQRYVPTEAEIRAWWSSGARPPIGAGQGVQPENPTGGGDDVGYTRGSGPIFSRKEILLGGDTKEPVTKAKPPISQFTGPITKPSGAQPESPSGGGDGTGWQSGRTGSGPLPSDPKTGH